MEILAVINSSIFREFIYCYKFNFLSEWTVTENSITVHHKAHLLTDDLYQEFSECFESVEGTYNGKEFTTTFRLKD